MSAQPVDVLAPVWTVRKQKWVYGPIGREHITWHWRVECSDGRKLNNARGNPIRFRSEAAANAALARVQGGAA